VLQTRFLRIKRYFSSQFYIATELRIFLFQGIGVILLALPQVIPNIGIYSLVGLLLGGSVLQLCAALKTRKALIHESFLKGRLECYFENHPGIAEDEKAEFYRHELTSCLNSIAEQLGFHQSPHHRIRLFLPIESYRDRKFSLVTFHTDNPDLEHSRNNDYPDEGILGQALRFGSCYVSNLPIPDKDISSWKNSQREKGYLKSDASIDAINFKARSYFALAVRNFERGPKTGIIVIESALPYISQSQAMRTIERQYSWYMGKCLNKFTEYAPDPIYAKDRGF
jgi:hypothetical protein